MVNDTLNDVERKIYGYLREKMKKGESFFKSRHISKDLRGEITAHQIGTSLFRMSQMKNLDLKITQYAMSGNTRTTWKVERCLHAKSVS